MAYSVNGMVHGTLQLWAAATACQVVNNCGKAWELTEAPQNSLTIKHIIDILFSLAHYCHQTKEKGEQGRRSQ